MTNRHSTAQPSTIALKMCCQKQPAKTCRCCRTPDVTARQQRTAGTAVTCQAGIHLSECIGVQNTMEAPEQRAITRCVDVSVDVPLLMSHPKSALLGVLQLLEGWQSVRQHEALVT